MGKDRLHGKSVGVEGAYTVSTNMRVALLQSGDRVRIDLRRGEANILIDEAELERRLRELEARGGYAYPASQTPWHEIHRTTVGQISGALSSSRR